MIRLITAHGKNESLLNDVASGKLTYSRVSDDIKSYTGIIFLVSSINSGHHSQIIDDESEKGGFILKFE